MSKWLVALLFLAHLLAVSESKVATRVKQKVCMRCRLIYDPDEGLEAQREAMEDALEAAQAQGEGEKADQAAKEADRAGMAEDTGDPFYGTNEGKAAAQAEDADKRECLEKHPEDSPERRQCLEDAGAPPRRNIPDQMAIINPEPKEIMGGNDKDDPRATAPDPEEEYQPSRGGGPAAGQAPNIEAPFVEPPSGFLELSSARRSRDRGSRDRVLDPRAWSLSDWAALARGERRVLRETRRMRRDDGAAAAGDGMAAGEEGDDTEEGSSRKLKPEDIAPVGSENAGSTVMVILSTEVCANEKSRKLVHSLFYGFGAESAPGLKVDCVDADQA